MRLTHGIDLPLKTEATRILMEHRRATCTLLSEKRDWLTENQLANRATHEVLSPTGTPSDRALYRGQFGRVFNPLFGKHTHRERSEDY